MSDTPVPPQADDHCTCGMGNAPVSHHDDHCALQRGAYFREGEPVPGEAQPAPAPASEAAIELHETRAAIGATIPDLPVIPANVEMTALAQMATTLAFADAVPKALRRKPNDVFLVLLTARDTGVALTTAMREFHVIEGTVTLSPKVKLAMVRQAGIGRIWPAPANDATGATWYAVRNDQPDHTVESTFTWEDAQLAGLVDSRCEPKRHFRNGNQSCMCKDNWKRYPQRMVSWRASGYLLDDVFPEVATGLYSPDELGAVTNADGEPIEVQATEGLPGMKGPRQTGQAHVEPASDGDRAEVHARLAGLTPAGRQAMSAWWLENDLPKVDELAARQMGKVVARLNWQEQQPGSKAEEEPQEPADGDEAPEEPETPAAPETSQEGPEPAPEADPARAAEEGNLVGWVIETAQQKPVAACKADFRAAGMQPPAGNDDVVRRAWCEWTLVQLVTATLGWISLAITGLNLVDPDEVAEAYAEAIA